MNELRCTVEWGSYWWHLRLGMLNYTHECFNDTSSAALLTVPFRQNHSAQITDTDYHFVCVKCRSGPVSWLWYPLWCRAVFDKAGNFDPCKSSHLIHVNRGSCSISNCISSSKRKRREQGREGDGENKTGLTPLRKFLCTCYRAFIVNYLSVKWQYVIAAFALFFFFFPNAVLASY